MLEKIMNLIRQYVSSDAVIEKDSNLITDLGLTSFDLATMAADLEDEFEISIDTSEIMEIKTVSDIEDCIRRHL